MVPSNPWAVEEGTDERQALTFSFSSRNAPTGAIVTCQSVSFPDHETMQLRKVRLLFVPL